MMVRCGVESLLPSYSGFIAAVLNINILAQALLPGQPHFACFSPESATMDINLIKFLAIGK